VYVASLSNNESLCPIQMRKALSKMGLKPVSGIVRVTIKKGKNVLFVISDNSFFFFFSCLTFNHISRPEVFKSASDTYPFSFFNSALCVYDVRNI
jgi:NACalpha-BTF3-like transcription factor